MSAVEHHIACVVVNHEVAVSRPVSHARMSITRGGAPLESCRQRPGCPEYAPRDN